MPEEGIGTKVSVLGDKEYKAALADIGRQLTVLNTAMVASQSAFDGQGDAMDALKAKSASLQSIYDAQARKVKLVSEQLEKAKQDYGENSKQVDSLQIALNRAQTAMNKTGSEIRDTEHKLDAMTAALEENAQASDEAGEGAEKAGEGAKKEGNAAEEAKEKNSRLGDAMSVAGRIAGGALKKALSLVKKRSVQFTQRFPDAQTSNGTVSTSSWPQPPATRVKPRLVSAQTIVACRIAPTLGEGHRPRKSA